MEPQSQAQKPEKKIEKRKVICCGPIYHEGADYDDGDEIELSEPVLSLWLENGTVREKS